MRISDWSSDVCSSDLNWSVGRAPAHHRQLAGRIAKAYIPLGNIVGDAKHLVTAKLGHRLMVGGRIIDMASADRLFDAADARSEERRVGKEGVSTCRSRWAPSH